jgi:hypothetical protein
VVKVVAAVVVVEKEVSLKEGIPEARRKEEEHSHPRLKEEQKTLVVPCCCRLRL